MTGLRKSILSLIICLGFSFSQAQVIEPTDSVSETDSVIVEHKIGQENDPIIVINDTINESKKIEALDTLKKKWKFKVPLILYEGHKNGYNPKVAWKRSALIPGMGQIYNHRWFKPIIIWAGFAGLGYLIAYEAKEYGLRRAFHKCSLNDNCTPSDALLDAGYNPATASENYRADRDFYRRNLELAIMGSVLWYTLNIVDAYVDAHLRDFNITDDLSFKLKPELKPVGSSTIPSAGIGLSFTFKQSKK